MYTRTIVAGRFTKDPQSRSYKGANGDGVIASFTLAADYGRDKTAFYDCIAFNKTAELILEHFNKGRAILVEGTMQNNNYEKDVNGTAVTMYGMQLVVNQLTFIDSKSDNQGGGQRQQGGQQPYQQQQQQQQPYQQQQQGGFQQPNQQQQQGGFQQGGQQGGFSGGFTGGFTEISDDDVPF